MTRIRGLSEIMFGFVILCGLVALNAGTALNVIGFIASFLFMADGIRVLFKGDSRREVAAQRALAVESAQMAAALAPKCPECQEKLEPAVMECGACGATVRKACAKCSRPMLLDVEACIFCGSREFSQSQASAAQTEERP